MSVFKEAFPFSVTKIFSKNTIRRFQSTLASVIGSKRSSSVAEQVVGPIQGQLLGQDRLASHARSVARQQKLAPIARPDGSGPLLRRLDDSNQVLAKINRSLGEATATGVDISSAGEWLLDNYYVIQEHIREIRTGMPQNYYQELPKLASGKLAGYPRIYELAIELIARTEGRLDLDNISLFVGEFQRVTPLKLGELWAIPTMLRLGLIENIRRMALRTAARLDEVKLADEWSERLRKASSSKDRLTDELAVFIDLHPPLTPAFVARFLSQIRSYQTSFAPLIWLEQWIAEDGLTAEEAVTRSNRRIAITQVTITNSINSLRAISRLDWNEFVENQSVVEKVLRQDPAQVYTKMAFHTRDEYRHVIERIAKKIKWEEDVLAKKVLSMATRSEAGSVESHIGYWLVDDGRVELEQAVGYQPDISRRIHSWALQHPNTVYFGSIAAILVALLAVIVPLLGLVSSLSIIGVVLLLLIPVSEVAVVAVNQIITAIIKPRSLPKLDFDEQGIPDQYETVVVIPTLFGSVSAVHEALEHIEVQFLANRDKNLKFAILSDFTDAHTESHAADEHILGSAARGIEALNKQYRENGQDMFYLLHRKREWNPVQNVWMGWERKRGKLAQFNRFLQTGDLSPFFRVVGGAQTLKGIGLVITLDADTVLPRGAAHAMIGAIAHPLNRPVYDESTRSVLRGYGILQPRVGIALTSAHRSRFAAIHSGHPGVDPYTTAVSDVYQDLYGEGSYTGKGIYDVSVFEKATHGRFPENTLLSHDLIEGTYARAGLLTDVEVYDEYPSRYLSYTRRKHRWIRGDWQIARWLRNTVPGPDGTEQNRLTAISRWKIFDNLRRSLVEISQVLLLVFGWFVLPGSPIVWTAFVGVLIAFPWLFSTFMSLIRPPKDQSWKAYYSAVMTDTWANVQQFALAVTFLPHQAVISADAIVRTIIRLTVTKKNLLEWQTASQVERAMRRKNNREAYKRMWPAIALVSVLFVMVVIYFFNAEFTGALGLLTFAVATLPLLGLWFASPAIATALSARAIPGEIKLSAAEKAAALRYAALHWEYFNTFVSERTNWLAPDNFQGSPEPVIAYRTSPTNIGLQLLSIVCAEDLGFINRSEMIEKLENVFRTLERMPRYHGHFYNWYDIETLEVLEPAYVSTVDSGNLAGHLIALKQACIQMIHEIQPRTVELEISGRSLADGLVAATSSGRLKGTVGPSTDNEDEISDDIARLRAIADRAFLYAMEMDFRFLFDEQRKLFSIGYQTSANGYDNSFYDLLASEARLTSFIAIAKGDVSVDHWFRLGRSLTEAAGTRVLVSWSGSMFEYLMPVLVTQTYPFTLLDQTCHGAVRQQIVYGDEKRVPWGISESAYNVRDRAMVYQYRAFGVPRLALKRGLSNDLVIAPYATVLAMQVSPQQALKNLAVLEAEGALGTYGFRDAIDYTRPNPDSRKAVVDTYMAHHIGMSLVAFTNALKRQIWQRRFHADPLVRSNELVLHERIPRKLIIQEGVTDDIPPRLPKEVTKPAVREVDSPHTPQPRVALLGNVPYTMMITNSGGGYTRYDDIAVTRWRRDTTRDNQGEWIYLKDLSTGRVWSATHQPLGIDADIYKVQFASDRVRFLRRDGEIDTQMEVVVSSDDAAAVRKLTITNRSSTVREIELTSYAEIVLQSLDADRQHPAFGNLFIQTEWSEANSAILATRRPRSEDEKVYWAAHVVACGPEKVGPVTFETDRAKFIGRGKSVRHPEALEEGIELSNTAGAPLDPIFSLRVRLRIEPGKMAQVSFTTIFTDTRERALQLADLYDNPFSARRALDLSWAQAQAELRDLGISPTAAAIYQQFVGYILYPHPKLRPTSSELHGSRGGQQSLWPHGISGDLPIVLATIDSKDGLPSVRQLLEAHQYWRIKGVACDLIILNEHAPSYMQELNELLTAAVMSSGESVIMDRPGGVHIRRTDVMTPGDVALIRSMARVHVVCDGLGLGSLLDFSDQREEFTGRSDVTVPPKYAKRIAGHRAAVQQGKPLAPNGYGQFNENGEYEIKLSGTFLPPAPWSNVIANPNAGFSISEAGSSCTWVENSFFYRLTPWHNDPVRDPCSDCIYLRDEDTGDVWTATPAPIRELTPYTIRHGLGYSVFEHTHDNIHTALHVTIAEEDSVKISRIRISNNGSTVKRITVTSYVEWVLGVSRDLTQNYVRTSYDRETESILAQNYFDETYAHKVAFLAMSGPISSYSGDRREFIGRNGTPARPAALSKTMLSESVGETVDPCGALQKTVVIEPNSYVDVVVLLGAHNSEDEARATVREYKDVDFATAESNKAVAAWAHRLSTIHIKTPDEEFDRINNGWMMYQALSCRMWGRSALYQSSGAYGFRDQLQDCMAFVYIDPGLVREHIIRAAGRQFVEGDVQHWWHPQTGRGVRTRFSDDLVWLPFVVDHYIQVTGDESILDEQVPFIEMRPLEPHEQEVYDLPHESTEVGSVLEHCVRALKKASTFGSYDLPLIGGGDWNDGFSRVGVGGKGQSVWLAWFLITTLTRIADRLAARGTREDVELRDQFLQTAERYRKAIESHAWDGAWYNRAYFDDGAPLGSHTSDEAKIDSIAQSWSVISGAGDRDRSERAMQSVEQHLVRQDGRLIMLLTPPFNKSAHDPGYIKGYLPGVRENGAQYTHAALWAVLARALQGHGDKAFELYQLINPLTHTRDIESVQRYHAEPYVVAADVYTAEGHLGRGGWSWYTGSASWMYRVALEAIIGFTKRDDTLTINPCIPSEWTEFSVRYRYGSSLYTIEVKNPDHVERGVRSVSLNGQNLPDGVIRLEDNSAENQIEVIMG